jgi:hypothetical protein
VLEQVFAQVYQSSETLRLNQQTRDMPSRKRARAAAKDAVDEEFVVKEYEEVSDGLPLSATTSNRPPPVNSDVLPLPWKGRLGYVSMSPSNWKCLVTVIRLV